MSAWMRADYLEKPCKPVPRLEDSSKLQEFIDGLSDTNGFKFEVINSIHQEVLSKLTDLGYVYSHYEKYGWTRITLE